METRGSTAPIEDTEVLEDSILEGTGTPRIDQPETAKEFAKEETGAEQCVNSPPTPVKSTSKRNTASQPTLIANIPLFFSQESVVHLSNGTENESGEKKSRVSLPSDLVDVMDGLHIAVKTDLARKARTANKSVLSCNFESPYCRVACCSRTEDIGCNSTSLSD